PDDVGQGLTLHELHGDEWLAVVVADVEDRDDVRVTEPGSRARLTRKALAQLFVIVLQDLDGDLAFEPRVPDEVQGAHAALPNWANDLIAPDADGGSRHSVNIRNGTKTAVKTYVSAWA